MISRSFAPASQARPSDLHAKAGVPGNFAIIGRGYFDGAAHFIEARADALAHAFGE